MNVRDFATRSVVTALPTDSVVAAAKLMREHHVGSIVVVDAPPDEGGRALGMLTDRDIAIGVVAQAPDAIHRLTVGDVMTADVVTVAPEDDLFEAIRAMTEHGVRRVPVVSDRDGLVGLISVDDVLEAVSDQLGSLVDLLWLGRNRERRERP